MPLGGLAEGAFGWLDAIARDKQQQYQQALLQLNQQNAALRRQQVLAGLAQQQRQQQAQAAIAQSLAGMLGPGGQAAPAPGYVGPTPQPPSPAPSPMPTGGGAPPGLARQVLGLEGNKDYAVGGAGELGPGQIKPSTGAEYGYSPAQLVGDSGRQASSAIVGDLYRKSGGDAAATLVGYNAGPGAMRKFQASGDNPNSVKLAPAYAKAVAADLSPEQQSQASQAAITAAGMLPPAMVGRAPPGLFAQLVERVAGSDAPDDVKGAALMQLLPLMSQEGQRQFAQQWEMTKFGAEQTEKQREFGQREQELSQQHQFMRDIEQQRLGQGQQKIDIAKEKNAPVQTSPGEVDFYANILANGGQLPPGLSRTAAGSKLVQTIMQKVPQMAGGNAGNLMSRQAGQKANERSLGNMQKMADSAISFERTAEKNFDLALSQSKGAVPTDWGPLLNKWIESGETQMGNKDVPPYVASLLTAADEYAKVMSGSTGSQGSTVDSRKAAAELFSPYLSSGQIERVVAIAKADMANRKNSLDEQLDFIRDRIKTAGSGATTEERQGKPAGSPPYKAGDIIEKGGKRWRVTGGDPRDPDVEPAQ